MKRISTSALVSLLVTCSSSAFVATRPSFGNNKSISSTSATTSSTIAPSSANHPSVRPLSQPIASSLAMSNSGSITDTQFDIVKVDLSDGRDYPIYIGDGFDDVEAGKLLRSHIAGKRALLITNDRIEQWYLEKYKNLLQDGSNVQIGECEALLYNIFGRKVVY